MTTLTKNEVATFVKNALKSKDVPKMKRAVAIYDKWENNAIGGNYLDKLPNDILDFIKTKIPLKTCDKIKLYSSNKKQKHLTFKFADDKFGVREMANNYYYKKRLSMLWINSLKKKLNWVVGEEMFINTKCNVDNYFFVYYHREKDLNRYCPYDLEIDAQGYLYGSYWEKTTESYVRVKLNCKYNDIQSSSLSSLSLE